jgi:hypothetical protein
MKSIQTNVGETAMKITRREQGQALVLVILCIVVMLGFAALAIDGGRTYAEKRRAQSAADAAAYAAAMAASDGKSWMQAALNQLEMNDFKDPDGNQNLGSVMDVMVYNPPVDGPYSPGEITNNENPNLYFQVKIRLMVEQVFSQVVFPGKQEISVEAVTKSRPIASVTAGNAMHATNLNACKAVWFNGTGDSLVDGGNIFSNSEAVGNCASGQQNGSGKVNVSNGEIHVVGTFREVGGSGIVSPNPSEGVSHQSLANIPVPDCSGLPSQNTSSNALQPGVYAGGIDIHNGTWTMAAGMYCLKNDFRVNGGKLTGKNVLIVMLNGSVDMNGNADIILRRSNNIKDSAGNQFGGMLFFMPYSNEGGIDLGGNSGTSYAGTIYAPGPRDSSKNKCTFGGNSGTIGISSNIICNTIEVHGTANVEIHYKANQNYRLPPMLEMSQ